jgi:predicted transcriptional regulator
MNSRLQKQAAALAALSSEERSRLNRLAALVGTSAEEIWPTVYRYGFDDIEESVQAGLDAEADLAAGRTVLHEEVMADIQRMFDRHDAQQKRRTG